MGEREYGLLVTLVLLACIYVFCQIPAIGVAIYGLFVPPEEQLQCDSVYNYMAMVTDTLYIVKASVNLLVFYPCAALSFCKAWRRMTKCKWRSTKVHSQTDSVTGLALNSS